MQLFVIDEVVCNCVQAGRYSFDRSEDLKTNYLKLITSSIAVFGNMIFVISHTKKHPI